MTARDSICGMLLGLAVINLVGPPAMGAEVKRLPPVESQPANQSSAPAKARPTLHGVAQSVWLQDAAVTSDKSRAQSQERAVQLVNWNDEPFVPPVEIELDGAEQTQDQSVVRTYASPFTKLVSQQDPPVPPQPAADSSQSVPPAPPSGAASPKDPAAAATTNEAQAPAVNTQPPEPPAQETGTPETIDAGTPSAEDDCVRFETTCCPLTPCWYFQADALMLFRSDTRTIKFVEHGTGAAVRGQRPALVTTDDLDPNPAWGPRFTLGRYLCDTHNLELVYFGMHNWSSQAAFNGINGVGFSFNNIDVPFDANITSDFDGAQYISGDYASTIHNAEANLVTNNRWDLNATTGFPWYHYVDFLMGFRYFRLSEEFDLRSTDAGQTSDYVIDTVNDLVGGQVGMVFGTYHSPRVSWNVSTKAGMFANFGRQTTLMRDDNNTVLFRDFETEGREIAFVGDTNFSLAYDIRPNMSVTAGYYLLYVGGVALAPEQLDFTTTPTSGSSINQNGGAFYHGPSIGLRINY